MIANAGSSGGCNEDEVTAGLRRREESKVLLLPLLAFLARGGRGLVRYTLHVPWSCRSTSSASSKQSSADRGEYCEPADLTGRRFLVADAGVGPTVEEGIAGNAPSPSCSMSSSSASLNDGDGAFFECDGGAGIGVNDDVNDDDDNAGQETLALSYVSK